MFIAELDGRSISLTRCIWRINSVYILIMYVDSFLMNEKNLSTVLMVTWSLMFLELLIHHLLKSVISPIGNINLFALTSITYSSICIFVHIWFNTEFVFNSSFALCLGFLYGGMPWVQLLACVSLTQMLSSTSTRTSMLVSLWCESNPIRNKCKLLWTFHNTFHGSYTQHHASL